MRWTFAITSVLACGQASAPQPVAIPVAKARPVAAPTPVIPSPTLQPPVLARLSSPRESSSPLVLARLDGRTVAVLADEDERRIAILELETGAELTAAVLPGTPGHAIVDGDGRIHVAIRDRSLVLGFRLACAAGFEPCAPVLVEAQRWKTPEEPIALGLADDGASVVATCGWGRALVSHPIAEGGRARTIPLAAEPRGFVVDGVRVWVAHAVGSRITAVSLDDDAVVHERSLDWRDDVTAAGMRLTNVPRFAVQGIAIAVTDTRVIVPMVLAYPGEPETEAEGYGMSIEGLEPFFGHEPVLAVLDRTTTAAQLRLRHEVLAADSERASSQRRAYARERRPCLLPRATAIDAARERVLVACQDLGQIVALSTEDVPLERGESARWQVGAGTTAIAIDPGTGDAWAWSAFDRRLDRLALASDDRTPAQTFTLAATAIVPDAAGRLAFHTPRASDGRSCAGCHVDGRDDGLVWQSPRGMVQTPVLAGRTVDAGPFGWHGEQSTLAGHIRRTFARLEAGTPDDATVAALAGWIGTMPTHRTPTELDAAQQRGRELFRSAATACADCHVDDVGSDGVAHRIGRGVAHDTPSLRFVGDTAPYMHDGRYATLREVLAHTDGAMGSTAALDDRELGDLIAYLRVL